MSVRKRLGHIGKEAQSYYEHPHAVLNEVAMRRSLALQGQFYSELESLFREKPNELILVIRSRLKQVAYLRECQPMLHRHLYLGISRDAAETVIDLDGGMIPAARYVESKDCLAISPECISGDIGFPNSNLFALFHCPVHQSYALDIFIGTDEVKGWFSHLPYLFTDLTRILLRHTHAEEGSPLIV